MLISKKIALLMALLLLLLSIGSEAQSDEDWGDWQDEPASPWQFSGFVEAGYGQFLQSNITKKNQSLSEFRSRFDVSYQADNFLIKAKADAVYDDVLGNFKTKMRELNVSGRFNQYLDYKIGRQVLTWGTGDYLFLNDLFAKDWQSFFAGRDDEFLKAPSDSIRLTSYIADVTIDFAYTPQFTSDTFITGERFSFYSPAQQKLVAPAKEFNVNDSDEDQFSLKIGKRVNRYELAFYGYQGLWPTPQGFNDNGSVYFPKLNAYGASIRGPLSSGLFNAEIAYYQSNDDKSGRKPTVANSQLRLLVGYEWEWFKNLTVNVQYYVEHTQDFKRLIEHSFWPQLEPEEYRQLLTTRLTYRAMQQRLTYSLFVFYSPSDKDSYIRPSMSFRVNDQWAIAAGLNLFSGRNQYSFFGQHEDNSNAWLRARFNF